MGALAHGYFKGICLAKLVEAKRATVLKSKVAFLKTGSYNILNITKPGYTDSEERRHYCKCIE